MHTFYTLQSPLKERQINSWKETRTERRVGDGEGERREGMVERAEGRRRSGEERMNRGGEKGKDSVKEGVD